jgi:hypothetical protein
MGFGVRLALIAFAMTWGYFGSSIAWAGDDGAAPLWQGIGSIFGWTWGGGGDKDPIDYREHGKIVVPPKMDLPPPGSSASGDTAWPVNQEGQRKKAEKEAAKDKIAGEGDARLRYTHPFPPNTPVTVRTTDDQLTGANGATDAAASSPLGSLNPLNWVGMGKNVPLGPEPDREWLTDPPKGFRAPVGPVEGSATN